MPTNDPYSRPINATRPDAVLVGEFYGRPATDKARSHAAGRRDAVGVRALPSVVPAVIGAPKPKPTRKRKPTTPSPDATSPSEPLTTVVSPITEDDLFG
jgi:hypothetical protein